MKDVVYLNSENKRTPTLISQLVAIVTRINIVFSSSPNHQHLSYSYQKNVHEPQRYIGWKLRPTNPPTDSAVQILEILMYLKSLLSRIILEWLFWMVSTIITILLTNVFGLATFLWPKAFKSMSTSFFLYLRQYCNLCNEKLWRKRQFLFQ